MTVRCWDGSVFSLRSDSEAKRLERAGILQIVTGSHDDKLKYKHEFGQVARQVEADEAAGYATREMRPAKPGRKTKPAKPPAARRKRGRPRKNPAV